MSTMREMANAVRFLSIDAVQQARSGHPGAPMGMADFTVALWTRHLRHNPLNPGWWNRDRFVLSNGHASMLLYSMLHLTGYDLSIEDIKQFRQLGSRTAGHPEYRHTPGVETTTGPLGQGIANAVGMALAETMLAAQFNTPEFKLIDHFTYVVMGDGCMMEGLSHEACSLAGSLKLGKLIALYDDNGISIDGAVTPWFSDNTPARFAAYGWHVIADVDGHDPDAVDAAIAAAKAVTDKPSLICCKTIIGYGSPTLCGSEKCHGAPLGDDEIARTRAELGWPHPPFCVPEEIYAAMDARPDGRGHEDAWNELFEAYTTAHPELAAALSRRMHGGLPADFQELAASLVREMNLLEKPVASRKSSQMCLDALAPHLPELVGGSADLAESNCTHWKGAVHFRPDAPTGTSVNYGVREFAMAAIMNGLALHGGVLPFGGTFLVFSDYMRNAMRMSALMGLRVIYVLTHDSIGVGEDGPTHQPVEHVSSLRLIPNLAVWRPADAAETAAAWTWALAQESAPSALCLTRQNLAPLVREGAALANLDKGGYVLLDAADGGDPQVLLMATGSEVMLAVRAARQLADEGVRVRVVSMPCLELFDAQPRSYKDAVLPPAVTRRLAVEAGATGLWHKYVGSDGAVIGMDRYGLSAPADKLFPEFGITVERIVALAREML
ncbi:transketolase [Megalodesulfovibrio gigas]|uniref:Transketolase n=1 Tax=Megalodesulfovibrio gigas (strain ATCC 19364 / DSM 1382 / NCIMB 9332 / VKM B-1759) TaxID=1121448 RepID=T2GAJ5_MEGG1|nr:transketolase [Megalodesulfovibrio gigas]AGW13199.1 putative transketolase [Megalodesulfovibrio gigas DSM 1382 = ATCC 19364]